MKNNKRHIFSGALSIVVIILFCLLVYIGIDSSSVVPVLMYHSIHKDEETSLFVSPEVFERQMKFLAEHKYNVIGPDDVIAIMNKEKKMPPKTVCITVDDGFYNFYRYGFPVLKKYNLKAALLIPTDKIGRPGRLGWKELREMSDSGLIMVESHTRSHAWLPSISVDEKKLNDELAGSKNILEKGLGKKVEYLAYPNGAFNDLVKEAAKKAGYKGAFTVNPAKKSDIHDIYAIRRIKMSSSSDNPLILWGKLSRYYAWFKEHK